MNYIVLDKEGELIDILDFTPKSLKAYKLANPSHIIKEPSKTDLDEEFLLDSDDDLTDLTPDMDDGLLPW